jgi:Spy/CpxP family protein refolding chaperone
MEISTASSRKAIALLVLVLLLGIALGVVGTTVVNRRVYGARAGNANRTRPFDRLTRELKLTPSQQTQVKSILSDMQSKYDVIRRQDAPQFSQVRQQGRQQIRQLLSPEQKPKFEQFLSEIDRERRRRNTR